MTELTVIPSPRKLSMQEVYPEDPNTDTSKVENSSLANSCNRLPPLDHKGRKKFPFSVFTNKHIKDRSVPTIMKPDPRIVSIRPESTHFSGSDLNHNILWEMEKLKYECSQILHNRVLEHKFLPNVFKNIKESKETIPSKICLDNTLLLPSSRSENNKNYFEQQNNSQILEDRIKTPSTNKLKMYTPEKRNTNLNLYQMNRFSSLPTENYSINEKTSKNTFNLNQTGHFGIDPECNIKEIPKKKYRIHIRISNKPRTQIKDKRKIFHYKKNKLYETPKDALYITFGKPT